jgi:F-type H+-transporting ATPase subunit delta
MPNNRLIVKEQIATYANVLFETAQQNGGQSTVLEVREQLKQTLVVMRTSAELREALKDPAYTAEQRAQVARGMFGDCNPALVDVLAVMAERGEADLLSRVADAYEGLLADKLNLCVVEVVTAVELDDNLREVIKKKASTELGREVVLEEKVDGSILGGIVMSANGQRIDMSVRTQIDHANETLKQS